MKVDLILYCTQLTHQIIKEKIVIKKLKVLELFSGTQSISKKYRKYGHKTLTVDYNPIFAEKDNEYGITTDLTMDVMDLTKEMIVDKLAGQPDVIWSSPDCSTYSVAAIYHHRSKEECGNLSPKTEKAELSDKVTQKVLEIISWFPESIYFIENPRGALRKMSFMQNLPRYTVTYCQYNDSLVERVIWGMKEKKCPSCGNTKPIEEFYKNASRKDGFAVYCKQCTKEQQHEYYLKNKEKCKERLQEWRKENREYVRERDKQYRLDNIEADKAKDKRYRVKNKTKLSLKGKKYRMENKEYFLNKSRERKYLIKEVSDGTITLEFEQETYKKQNGKCAYCSDDLELTGKHLDHIIPISKGGLHTSSNVHWTCPSCNLSKGDKLEDEWLKKERMKPSDIFTNHPDPQFKPPCKNGAPCHVAAPRGSSTGTQGLKNNIERARIPNELCEHIVEITTK